VAGIPPFILQECTFPDSFFTIFFQFWNLEFRFWIFQFPIANFAIADFYCGFYLATKSPIQNPKSKFPNQQIQILKSKIQIIYLLSSFLDKTKKSRSSVG
jgi:hypothetical protein